MVGGEVGELMPLEFLARGVQPLPDVSFFSPAPIIILTQEDAADCLL